MIWMKTTDNQYIIEFERKPCRIPNKDFQYICKIRFKNIFGMLLRELTFHENHIVIMLSLLYEYMQADILNVMQAKFDSELAAEFIDKTKAAIKKVIEYLQKLNLI